jgi:hypothetical protein
MEATLRGKIRKGENMTGCSRCLDITEVWWQWANGVHGEYEFLCIHCMELLYPKTTQVRFSGQIIKQRRAIDAAEQVRSELQDG